MAREPDGPIRERPPREEAPGAPRTRPRASLLFAGCTAGGPAPESASVGGTASSPAVESPSPSADATSSLSEAMPVEAVRAVVDALGDHAVVALGESHDLDEAGRFYDALVGSDAFAKAADAVVVEFGNARYQDLVDRYTSGEQLSAASVRRVWQDTTQVGAWDAPMYERFFRAVRDANADRSPAARIRILLGDPPIDWSTVAGEDDVKQLLASRERFMARLVERQIVARHRHAVIIAGLAHLERPTGATQQPNVTQQLDAAAPGSTYVVGVHLGFPERGMGAAAGDMAHALHRGPSRDVDREAPEGRGNGPGGARRDAVPRATGLAAPVDPAPEHVRTPRLLGGPPAAMGTGGPWSVRRGGAIPDV